MARRYGYGYGYGPEPRPGYDPYSKHPDWASGIRELLKNMQMMKQMKEERKERAWEREQRGKEFGLQRLGLNLDLQEASRKRRDEELRGKIAARKEVDREKWISKLDERLQPYYRLNKAPPASLVEQVYGEVDIMGGIEKDKRDKLGTDNKKIRIAKARIKKEITTLTKMAKLDKEEVESGEISEEKKTFLTQAQNSQGILDLIEEMERYTAEGTPLGKRMSSALSTIMNDFPRGLKGIKAGGLLDSLRTSWSEEAGLGPRKKQFRNKKTGKLDWFRWDGSKWIKE